jgi:hypothetical protein
MHLCQILRVFKSARLSTDKRRAPFASFRQILHQYLALGVLWCALAGRGLVGSGGAGLGKARLGQAGLGGAGQGAAWFGVVFISRGKRKCYRV